jgi:hypothetical protein
MGMGGYLALINATPYEWELDGPPISNHMNAWNSAFPASLQPAAA